MSKVVLSLAVTMTLLGFTTAVDVNAITNGQLPVSLSPIIGEALYEDFESQNQNLTGLLTSVKNISDVGILPRNLQAMNSPNEFKINLLKAVNQERAAHGLPPLCFNTKLEEAAQGHSNDMAEKDYMSHQGSDGSTMSQRIQKEGYDRLVIGENIAAGQFSVSDVMVSWMESPGHRANILREKFNMFGCGYAYEPKSTYKIYWTQNFGKSKTEKCS